MKKSSRPAPCPRTDEEKLLRRQRIIAIASVAVMIVFFIVVLILVGRPLIETFSEKEKFREWVNQAGFWGDLAMIGVSALQVVVAIIPGEPFELAAGYAFGWFSGMLLCMIGFAIASSIIFLLVKKYGMRFVLLFFSQEKIDSISFIKDSKRLDLLTFILFLIPGSPKDVLTYFVGVTPMTLPRFLLITMVARIPSIVSSTVTGALVFNNSWTPAIITYAITGVITVLCILLYRKLVKSQKSSSSASADPSKEE